MSHSELRLPSAKLRRKLGLVKATLGTIVKEVRSLELEQKVVEADDPVEDKIDKCEKRRNFIKSLTAKLDSNVNRVDSIVREWEDIIENSENSELVRDHEEALLGEMYAGKGSVIALAEEARTMVMDLKGYEEKMEKLLEELFSSKEKQTSIKNESGSVSNPAIFQWQLQVGALTVPTFDPEKDVFEVFWELFEETVDKVTDYTNIQKIFLLKRSLVGEAKELISTILPRAENYQIMIDTLKENYGMKEDSLDKLIEELIDRNPAKDWRQTIKTAKEIRIWINKGKLKGMDVDHPVITFIVKRKLPQKVVRRILETKPVKHSWTATQILDTIREMEKRENEIPSKETKFTTESSLSKQPKLELQKERETSAFHLQRKEKEPKKVSRSCIFCGEDHWNDECLKFKTKREREAIIKNKGLCMKCFHKDHKEGECQVKLKCYHCGRGHNRALCNQRRDYSKEKEEAVTVTASRKRDSTILMAREVTIRNPKNPRKRLTVLALFDSGSTDNYVREEITEKLDLEHSTSCLLKVTGFNERENEIRSKRVQLQLETINQKTVNFEAYTTTTLVKPVRIVDTSTVAELQDQSTQGYQPKLRKKKPDLILGINILQALSHPEETKRLETGFMWLPTEVGPITYMDTDSLEYLRPVDFLVPRAILTIDPNHEKEDKQEDDTRSAEQLRKRWQATQRCIKSFWNHWRKGYIGNLRERYQLKHKRSRSQVDRKPELGEIIIVKEEQQPRALWKLARVVEVPSEGTVRHVKIKTGNGKVLIRPINLLCPLEIRDATTKASAHANSRELPEQIEISEAGETDPLSFSGMS